VTEVDPAKARIARLLRHRGPGLVPGVPRLHPLRQGDLLPRHVAASRPPGESKSKETRYLDIREDDKLDEKQLATWIEQAASIPGWDGGSPRYGTALAAPL
jgi:hypothetical protein